MGRVTARHQVLRLDLDNGVRRRPDTVAVEEPLEIRLGGTSFTVTMRTPGNDLELVHGLLRSEGMITSREDIESARYCAGTAPDGEGLERNTYNVLDVRMREVARPLPVSAQRSLVMHSGCGLCGKTTIDAVAASLPHAPGDRDFNDHDGMAGLRPETVVALPDRLREGQTVFARTGGTHAAGLFTRSGEPVVIREDVGRHNAVDKVLGWAIMQQTPVDDLVLMVSSRASFEIVQKAAMCGIRVLAAVSAPSSLAVEAATDLGITLIGFVRGRSLSVYSHGHRLASSS